MQAKKLMKWAIIFPIDLIGVKVYESRYIKVGTTKK